MVSRSVARTERTLWKLVATDKVQGARVEDWGRHSLLYLIEDCAEDGR
jgi:ribosomal protein S6